MFFLPFIPCAADFPSAPMYPKPRGFVFYFRLQPLDAFCGLLWPMLKVVKPLGAFGVGVGVPRHHHCPHRVRGTTHYGGGEEEY